MMRRDPIHDILGVADGTLPQRRLARVLERATADPQARHLLEGQRRARSAIQGVPVRAPRSLRGRIDAMQSNAERTRLPAADIRRVTFAAAAACAVLALAVAITLVPSGDSRATAVAAIVHQPATEDPPPVGAEPGILDRVFAGLTFPSWTGEFDWTTTGARRGTVDGRATDTVFYSHNGHRVSYTVVDGAPLEPPEHARSVRTGATTAHVFHDDDDHTVVMFERAGKTCVLTGHVIHDSTLVRLAGWQGDGALEF